MPALDYIRKYSVLGEANNEYISDRPVFGYIEYLNVTQVPLYIKICSSEQRSCRMLE